MDFTQIRDLQVQAGARISTAIGKPIQVGDRDDWLPLPSLIEAETFAAISTRVINYADQR